jgi:hypothetical protein
MVLKYVIIIAARATLSVLADYYFAYLFALTTYVQARSCCIHAHTVEVVVFYLTFAVANFYCCAPGHCSCCINNDF